MTRKRHAVNRDDICRVQERFSVIELCLLKLGCWPVLGLVVCSDFRSGLVCLSDVQADRH
jgi:hypothetical protein